MYHNPYLYDLARRSMAEREHRAAEARLAAYARPAHRRRGWRLFARTKRPASSSADRGANAPAAVGRAI